jgi:hypothetical protein
MQRKVAWGDTGLCNDKLIAFCRCRAYAFTIGQPPKEQNGEKMMVIGIQNGFRACHIQIFAV